MSGVEDPYIVRDDEPDPSAIATMSSHQQVYLLQERSKREGAPKWTFCQSRLWPPMGNEFHWYPSSGELRIVGRNIWCSSLPECQKGITGYNMYQEG
eukprot:3364713-Ditylum_brightwellii.AAC.1